MRPRVPQQRSLRGRCRPPWHRWRFEPSCQVPDLRRIEGKASDPEVGTASGASASTAMRVNRLRAEGSERLDLAAAVRLAGRAHLMRPGRLVAVRAEAQARRGDAVLRAALVAPRL